MANAAHKIAGPIINKAFERAYRDFLLSVFANPPSTFIARNRSASRVDYRQLGGEVRTALKGLAHPAVIEDWAHEPRRRVQAAIGRLQQADRAAAARLAEEKRREKKRLEAAKRSRKARSFAQKLTTGARKVFARTIFRGAARGQ